MNKKRVWGMIACALLITASSAQGFFSLAIRVGCGYVGYKFVDGITDCSISSFVNQYKNGVVDAICSFGKGVERFGAGVRSVAVAFWYDDSDNSFSIAWKGVADQFGAAVVAMQSEWGVRSSAHASDKTKKIICESDESELIEKKTSVAQDKPKKELEIIV